MKTFFRIAVGCFALVGLLAVGFIAATNYRRIPAAWEYLKGSLGSDDAPTVVSRPVDPEPTPVPVPVRPVDGDFTGDRSCGKRLVPQRNEGLYVFVDERNGERPFEGRFTDARHFSDGLAAVEVDGSWGAINCSGELTVPARFEALGRFSEGLAAAHTGMAWGYVDASGELVIDAAYQDARHFQRGAAPVQTEKGWGFIDRKGAWVSEPGTSPYELREEPWPRERVAELGETFEVVEIGLTGAEELLVVDGGGRRFRVEGNRFVPTDQALAVREVSAQPPAPPSGPYSVRTEGELTIVRIDERTAEERILVRYPYLGDWSIGTWAWAPDGDRLYFDNQGAAACIWELDIESGELVKVVPEHGAERPRIVADADGLRIYYLYDQAIWVAHRP